MNEVTLVQAEDWEGLYHDDLLINEDHHISTYVFYGFVEKIIKFNHPIKANHKIEEYLDGNGGFPQTLTELKSLL